MENIDCILLYFSPTHVRCILACNFFPYLSITYHLPLTIHHETSLVPISILPNNVCSNIPTPLPHTIFPCKVWQFLPSQNIPIPLPYHISSQGSPIPSFLPSLNIPIPLPHRHYISSQGSLIPSFLSSLNIPIPLPYYISCQCLAILSFLNNSY